MRTKILLDCISINYLYIYFEDINNNYIPIKNLSFDFYIETLHAFLFNHLRIYFFSRNYLFDKCIGFAEIPLNALVQNSEAVYEIYDGREKNIYTCFEYRREVCGSVKVIVVEGLNSIELLKDVEFSNNSVEKELDMYGGDKGAECTGKYESEEHAKNKKRLEEEDSKKEKISVDENNLCYNENVSDDSVQNELNIDIQINGDKEHKENKEETHNNDLINVSLTLNEHRVGDVHEKQLIKDDAYNSGNKETYFDIRNKISNANCFNRKSCSEEELIINNDLSTPTDINNKDVVNKQTSYEATVASETIYDRKNKNTISKSNYKNEGSRGQNYSKNTSNEHNSSKIINYHSENGKEALNEKKLIDLASNNSLATNKKRIIYEIIKQMHFIESTGNNENRPLNINFFTSIINQDKYNDYYFYFIRIWRIFSFISKGSIHCKFQFWLGMYHLEGYYRYESNKYCLKNTRNIKKAIFRDNELHIKNIKNNNFEYNTNVNESQVSRSNLKDMNPNDFSYSSTDDLSLKKPYDKVTEQNYTYEKENNEIDESYALIHYSFYEYYLNKFYFSITPYGKYYLKILLVKERCKPDNSIKEPERSIISYLNIDFKDLIYVNLNMNETKTPHIVFYDKIEDELVVSFRGTFNHVDALNDLDCEYKQFLGGYAHSGIVNLAYFYIETHLNGLKLLVSERNYTKVLFTGQSLGGALCTLIHIILQGIEHNFKSRVISFSAPPCVSENLCEQKNITTIIYGYDIIARLCFGSLLDLKYISSSIPKMKTKVPESVAKVSAYLKETDLHPKLYIPGKLYHIRKFGVGNKMTIMGKEVGYEHFSQIIIHNRCFIHHAFTAFINAFLLGIEESMNQQLTNI